MKIYSEVQFTLTRQYLNEKKLQVKVISNRILSKRDIETLKNDGLLPSNLPMRFTNDEIFFYDNPNQFLLFSCDNSTKKPQPPYTDQVEVRSSADLDKLAAIKCECRLNFQEFA